MKKIQRLYRFLKADGSLFKTLYFNFKLLPFRDACKLPIAIGRRVEFQNLSKVKIKFIEGVKLRMFTVSIGLNKTEITSPRTLWSLLRFEENSELWLGEKVTIASGAAISVYKNAKLIINSRVVMNQRVKIFAKNHVEFGPDCRVGWESQFYDTAFHLTYIKDKNIIKSPYGKIVFGQNCWITNRCTVSGNVFLPPFSMLASGSVLNKDYSNITSTGNLFAGSPAVLKRTGIYRIFRVKKERELMKLFDENRDLQYIDAGPDFDIMDYQIGYK